MRTLLTRPEADTAGEETFVGFLIGDVLDLDARELYPEIQRAFAEDRADTSIITLLDVHDRWGLAPFPSNQIVTIAVGAEAGRNTSKALFAQAWFVRCELRAPSALSTPYSARRASLAV